MPALVAADDCRIHYDTFGTNGPRVLLVPGLGGDGRFYAGVVAALERDHRLIVLDHRGAGRSDRPEGPQSIETIAADAAALLKATGGPAHVVGHSTGGAVAQVLALDHAACGLSYTISSSWARADTRFRTLFTARAELLEAGLFESYQRLTHVFGHEPDYLAANAVRLEAAVTTARELLSPASIAAARVRMLLDHDRLDDLPIIRAPVLAIAADGDILIPPSLTRQIAETIVGAELVVVSGTHFHPMTRAETFAGLIRHFITRVSDAC
ncbi:alpha/beta hydrolase [Rhizobium sp. TRM95111]|uniref:alpha/beta fold hydrolase n=1 Tax=Rhizobium alarense TaxID=2846851 RepID=UPI001F16D712|nr:alpha/beta hydrolase [Rhizobium alarense]MCF3639277.1 alpha/beta hydrolase [Rhizobium alarense]